MSGIPALRSKAEMFDTGISSASPLSDLVYYPTLSSTLLLMSVFSNEGFFLELIASLLTLSYE